MKSELRHGEGKGTSGRQARKKTGEVTDGAEVEIAGAKREKRGSIKGGKGDERGRKAKEGQEGEAKKTIDKKRRRQHR